MPPTMANTYEVHEAWIKRKFEIHRKIAELEASHHEEEVDEEDDEYKQKIEKILKEELDKNKFYSEFEQNRRKESLGEIQDQEETTNHEKGNNIINNFKKFNDVAKSFHHEIIKNSKNQNSNTNEKQYEKENNVKQHKNIQNDINHQNNLFESNKANYNLERPITPTTFSQELTKTIDKLEDEVKSNSDQISTLKINNNFLYFLIPISVLIVIILVYLTFYKSIQRWLRHKRSDELPNSLKYN